MKIKDFLTKLKTDGKINLPEFEEYLKTAPDAEIPDVVTKAIEDNFMTLERAAVNHGIHSKIKREVLDPVDNEMNDLFDQYKDIIEGAESFKTDTNTYNKLKNLKKALPEAIKKLKGSPVTDEETKKKLVEYEKTIQEFGDKFTQAQKEYNAKLKETDTGWETKFHDFRLHSELEKLSNKYTLAEAFEETRPAITEVNLTKIKQSNRLKLGEKDGRPVIFVNDENDKPKYNGNTPVTVDSLLDEAYKPFLKKSETGTQTQVNTRTTTVSTNQNPAIRRGANTTVVQPLK
jgi:hypothetical protein